MALEECPYLVQEGEKPQFNTQNGLFEFSGSIEPIQKRQVVLNLRPPFIHFQTVNQRRGICLFDGTTDATQSYLKRSGLPAKKMQVRGPCLKCGIAFKGIATEISSSV